MKIATIGYFDGIHLGHQKLINRVVELANEIRLDPALYTFNVYAENSKSEQLIMSRGEKVKAIKELGISEIKTLIFSSIKNMTKEEFVENLKDEVHILVVGEDFRFGKDREGDVNYLKQCQDASFKVEIVPDVIVDGTKVSSTEIRQLIRNGEIKKANSLLYNNYSLEGEIVHGFGRGVTLGYRTANLELSDKLVKPKYGVYLSRVIMDDFNGYGMTMIGVAETFGTKFSCETNIFDFDKIVYGANMKIELLDFIRDNRSMESVDDLKAQLKKDKIKCIEIIKNDFTN